jgi:hypothetical protein
MAKFYTVVAALLSLVELMDFLMLYHWISKTAN